MSEFELHRGAWRGRMAGIRRSRNPRCPLVLALVVVLGGVLLTACGGGANPGGSITVYNGQHLQTTEALVSAFENRTGISVNIRSDDESVLADQIVTEGGRTPADVFLSENSPPLEVLVSKGLLAPVDRSTLARTPARFSSAVGKWVGISARVSVVDYNPSLLPPGRLPTSVMDLAQPRWKGKIGLAGQETDFQPLVTSIAHAFGAAVALRWLLAVKDNASGHLYASNEVLVDAINRGQVAVGIINQYYWYRERAALGASGMHSEIAYFAPRDVGYLLDVSGAAVLRSSKNGSAAQKFVAFMTSRAGQEIIAHGDSFEYPLASGVTTAQAETPFDELQPYQISIAALGTGVLAVRLLQEAQLL
ncbi:MAG TPA: extracellular solute-binding protein [Acidimicrobiales bacterium]|nr:extracellular solute-binding protein [Acidimicrobiales bacterium]